MSGVYCTIRPFIVLSFIMEIDINLVKAGKAQETILHVNKCCQLFQLFVMSNCLKYIKHPQIYHGVIIALNGRWLINYLSLKDDSAIRDTTIY